MTDKKKEAIGKILKELLLLLDVPAEFEIEREKEGKREDYQVRIKTEEPGILIGSHGQTLQALKYFLTLSLFKKFGEWVGVLVDVNDYWQKRKKELSQMAKRIADQVVETGKPITLSYLSSAERRIVHLALSSHPQVVSESQGEGRERKLVIKPRP